MLITIFTKGPPPSSLGFRGPLNDPKIGQELTRFAAEHNRDISLAGLDRYGKPLPPWRTRGGKSDYSGKNYAAWTCRTRLVPFGEESRRIDDFHQWYDRSAVRPDGSGSFTLTAGFTSRSRGLQIKWLRDGFNVLGLDPAGLDGFRKILSRYAPQVVFSGRATNFPRVPGQPAPAMWRPLAPGEALGRDQSYR